MRIAGGGVATAWWSRRRWWRQAERRAVGDHECEVAARLAALEGSVVERVVAGPLGTVLIVLPGWLVALTPQPGWGSRVASDARPARLSSAGRYGRLWWLEVVTDAPGHPARMVVGSSLGIHPRCDRERGTGPLVPVAAGGRS